MTLLAIGFVLLGACWGVVDDVRIHAPRPIEPRAATVDAPVVDTDCVPAHRGMLCTVDAHYTVAAIVERPDFVVKTDRSIANAIRIDGNAYEPYFVDNDLKIETDLTAGVTASVSIASRFGIPGPPEYELDPIHPLFGQERDRSRSAIHVCVPAGNRQPSFRSIRLPEGVSVYDRVVLRDHDEDCATLAMQRRRFPIWNSGPVVGAGYVTRQGFAAELGYDLAIWNVFTFEAAARLGNNGEWDAIPLFGFPAALKIGIPIDVATGDVAFRVQFDLHVAPGRTWHFAPGGVIFHESWHTHANRWGFLASVSF